MEGGVVPSAQGPDDKPHGFRPNEFGGYQELYLRPFLACLLDHRPSYLHAIQLELDVAVCYWLDSCYDQEVAVGRDASDGHCLETVREPAAVHNGDRRSCQRGLVIRLGLCDGAT